MVWGQASIYCDFPGCSKEHPVACVREGTSETMAFMEAADKGHANGWDMAFCRHDDGGKDLCPRHAKGLCAFVEVMAQESAALGGTPNRDALLKLFRKNLSALGGVR